jgi:hypothetical protein
LRISSLFSAIFFPSRIVVMGESGVSVFIRDAG